MSRSSGRSRSEGEPPSGKSDAAAVLAHGWSIYFHPAMLDQLDRLIASVEAEQARHPDRYTESADFKVLSAIAYLVFDLIPRDPARKEYRQGQTLGEGRKHWFRAKFGAGRFRLFFRFRSDARVIVFAWVNDQDTLRTYGSRTDAYAEFARRLSSGNPPDDWDALMREAAGADTVRRSRAASTRISRARKPPE